MGALLVHLKPVHNENVHSYQERIEPANSAREHVTTIDGEIQTRLPDAKFSNNQIWARGTMRMLGIHMGAMSVSGGIAGRIRRELDDDTANTDSVYSNADEELCEGWF